MTNPIIDISLTIFKEGFEFGCFTLQGLLKKYKNFQFDQPERLLFYLIILFTKGKGQHFVNFKPYDYKPGTLFFLPKLQIQSYCQSAKDSDASIIIFSPKFFSGDGPLQTGISLFDPLVKMPMFVLALDEKEFEEFTNLFDTIREEFEKPAYPNKEEVLKSLLRLFVFKAERLNTQSPDKLKEETHSQDFIHFIEFQECLEANFKTIRNVKAYADLLNMSPKGLNRLTNQITNKSAKQLIDDRLVMEAKRLLASTGWSVKQICYELGFDEPSNFSKFIKHRINKTPIAYRKQIRQESYKI